MARTIEWLGAVALALGLLLGPRGAAAQESPAQPAADPAVWGIYAQLAGTTRQAVDGYRLHWRWARPGKELVEEYVAPSSGKLMHANTITPGPSPGTLHAAGSSLGGKQWNGTLQADGSVVFAGTGMLKMSYKAAMASDGAYEIRMVKLRDGVVLSVSEPAQYSRYLPLDDAAMPAPTAATAGTVETGKAATAPAAGSAGAAPGPAAPSVATAAVSASTPVADTAAQAMVVAPPAPAPPLDPLHLKQQNRAIRDYYERMINGPDGTPGVWLELTGSGSGISRYRRTKEGVESNFSFIRENGELAINQSAQHFDDERGRIIHYVDGEAVAAAQVTRVPGGAFRSQTLPGFGVSAESAARSFYDVAFIADRQEITNAQGEKKAYRWVPESEASSVQASIQKRQAWLEAQRVAAAQEEQARKESEQRAAAEAQRVALEQILEQQRMYAAMNARQELLDAQADAEFEMERQEKAARWAQTSAAAEQGLANSVSRLNNTVASVEAQQAQYRAQQQAAETAAANARRQSELENARAATRRQEEEAARFAAQQRAAEQQRAAAALTISSAPPQSNPGGGAGTVAAGGSVWFVFCTAIKPGPYMDAPGAMFLSGIASIDRKSYAAMQAQEAFGSRVNAQYGVSVGSSSCTSYPDRAAAQAGWQSQHDSFGMKFYKKVATGIPAVP